MSARYSARALSPIRQCLMAFREGLISLRRLYLSKVLGMDLHSTIRFSLKCNLDRTNPRGVHVGAHTYIAFGAVVLAHDMSRKFHADTFIGERCFIGAHAIILPGIRVGDGSIVGTGSVVTRDVPPGSIVAGNPAKIIREGIVTEHYGKLVG